MINNRILIKLKNECGTYPKINVLQDKILYVDNEGGFHIFRMDNNLPKLSASKSASQLFFVRRPKPMTKELNIRERVIGIENGAFIGESGKKYSTKEVSNYKTQKEQKQLGGIRSYVQFNDNILFVLLENGELHSRNEEYSENTCLYDDADIPDEIKGIKIKSIYYVENEIEGIVAVGEDGNIYTVGELPECIENLVSKDVSCYSEIIIDTTEDDEYFCVCMTGGGKLDGYSDVDLSELDTDKRDFFVTMKYMRNVKEFDYDIFSGVGAALNSDGKIMLWGSYENITEYENIIPCEFFAE